jgi:methylated-DNA-[protein]-cysteine S-methyltransferase
MVFYSLFPSPVGELLIAATDDGITHLLFERPQGGHAINDTWHPDTGASGAASAWLASARSQLAEYFGGRRRTFDVPLSAAGTHFQRDVWSALRDIDYGATISYGELARRIANPRAVRAVGLANGRNPISIIVPCHRVIGANGTLTGYGGGLDRKRWLLSHEHAR